jgi:FHS family glucose/mannose:H+ symporter-like MFS transporter
MGNTLGASPERMNLIITFFMIGEVTGILALIFLGRFLERKTIIIFTYIFMIPTYLSMLFLESLPMFYVLYYISGCLLGVMFMHSNLSMLEGNVENKDSVVNLGHGFFAIGALTAPLIASSLVNNGIDWRFLYIIVLGLAIISFISYLIANRGIRFGKLVQRSSFGFKEVFSDRRKNIYMVLTTVLMLFYVMSEVTVFSWAPTFFRVEKLFDLSNASLVASIFWIGILIGRLIISVLSYKYKAGLLLIVLSILSVLGLSLAIFPTGRIINFLGAGIIGLGFSGVPPLLISSGGKILGAKKDISLTILFVVGITSGSLIPFLIGSIAERSFIFSMIIALIFMSVFFAFVLIRKAYRQTLKR